MKRKIFYISPLTDFGFKKIFSDPIIMKRFLEVLFETEDLKIEIKSLTYRPQDSDGTLRQSRRVIYDVHCQSDSGDEFIVEMQNEDQYYWDNRIIFYMSRATSLQGAKEFEKLLKTDKKEAWNYNLKKVIGIFIMNFFDKNDHNSVARYRWTNQKNGHVLSDMQEIWKIQLPFFRKKRMKIQECKTKLDYWLYNLTNMGTMEQEMPFIEEEPVLERLSSIAQFVNMSLEEQEKYFHEIDDVITYNNVLRKKEDESFSRGEKKGRAEGLAQGTYKEKLESAQKMKRKGMSIEDIMFYTELSREEIEAIPV